MPRVGFELTITASERAKTVHALDRSATVTCLKNILGSGNVIIKVVMRKKKTIVRIFTNSGLVKIHLYFKYFVCLVCMWP
jgi:hypothetical protein